MQADRLRGAVALVTGGSRGIGAAIVEAFAQAGMHVVINCRAKLDEARAAAERINAAGGRAAAIAADVSIASEVDRLVAETRQALGPVSVLVNNAGIAIMKPFDTVTEGDFDTLYRVNLKSAFLVTRAVLPDMRQAGWGRIINVSSVAAQTGGVVGPHYASSKAGMIGLTHSYASLLAKEGITVNAIAPALVETDMMRGRTDLAARIPLGRVGHVDEVASIALMLAGNGYVTGQTVNANGGLYMSS
jgi:3-oxoacyl-[acyl-carrier protein] reductase